MTDDEALRQLQTLDGTLTEAELNQLESRLALRGAALGWTGDPLRQPPSVILSEVRTILDSRNAAGGST